MRLRLSECPESSPHLKETELPNSRKSNTDWLEFTFSQHQALDQTLDLTPRYEYDLTEKLDPSDEQFSRDI